MVPAIRLQVLSEFSLNLDALIRFQFFLTSRFEGINLLNEIIIVYRKYNNTVGKISGTGGTNATGPLGHTLSSLSMPILIWLEALKGFLCRGPSRFKGCSSLLFKLGKFSLSHLSLPFPSPYYFDLLVCQWIAK